MKIGLREWLVLLAIAVVWWGILFSAVATLPDRPDVRRFERMEYGEKFSKIERALR